MLSSKPRPVYILCSPWQLHSAHGDCSVIAIEFNKDACERQCTFPFVTQSHALYLLLSSLLLSTHLVLLHLAMADVEAQQSPIQPKPISRFSTCTSTRMAETNKHIVPMPAWMSITGVARFLIAILVLAFTAAATAIFGGYTAFGFTLFTVRLFSYSTSYDILIYVAVLCDLNHLRILLRGSLPQTCPLQSMCCPRP